jgi:hypothetical protein
MSIEVIYTASNDSQRSAENASYNQSIQSHYQALIAAHTVYLKKEA